MKKTRFGIVLLTLTAIAGAVAWAQQGNASSNANAQQKFVKVSTLGSIEANQEFQRNVQIVRAQRQQAVQLNAAIEKETDAAKKAELSKALEELMTNLNNNNAQMAKTYGFSLNRNYTMVVEKAHIYMFVTDEEAAAIQQKIDAAPKTSLTK